VHSTCLVRGTWRRSRVCIWALGLIATVAHPSGQVAPFGKQPARFGSVRFDRLSADYACLYWALPLPSHH
jgi:hypothetical protein